MVSTRGHPNEFASPTKSITTSPTSSTVLTPSTSPSPSSPTSAGRWSHTPSNLTLVWLAVSLPLVVWDTLYILGRPHTMPGGALHWPIWSPYELYGKVDYIYGWPAWESKDGFTAAQGLLNVVETLGYMLYLWVVYTKGVEEVGSERTGRGRGAPKAQGWGGRLQRLSRARRVDGSEAGFAVLLGFGISIMTVSKTVLYWLQEYLSGFQNIGHNDAFSVIFLWIIPNGLWIVVPSYMIYVFGSEILQGLAIATGESKKRR